MGWTCCVADMKNVQSISTGTPEWTSGVYLGLGGSIIVQGVDVIHLASYRDQRRIVMNVVINVV